VSCAAFDRTGFKELAEMAVSPRRNHAIGIHPVHATLVAAALPLFIGGLLSDLAYRSSFEIQWSNFAAWLIAGATLFVGLALLWSLVDLIQYRMRSRRLIAYSATLLATLLAGLFNSFVHARDAWAVMPSGLVLSAVATVLALISVGLGFWAPGGGDRR
jgi:uncharacterized membrane protein